jgi:anti-anti-sigma regulatory factor
MWKLVNCLLHPQKTLLFDTEGIAFMTSAGIGIIAKVKYSLKSIGGDIAMINLQLQGKEVFQNNTSSASLQCFH